MIALPTVIGHTKEGLPLMFEWMSIMNVYVPFLRTHFTNDVLNLNDELFVVKFVHETYTWNQYIVCNTE